MRPSLRRKLSTVTSRLGAPVPPLVAGATGGARGGAAGGAGEGVGTGRGGGGGAAPDAAGLGPPPLPLPPPLPPKGSSIPSAVRVTCTRGDASVTSRRRTRDVPAVAPGRSISWMPTSIDCAPTAKAFGSAPATAG